MTDGGVAGLTRSMVQARHVAWLLAAGLGAVVVAAGIAGESSAVAFGLLGLLALGTWIAWGHGPRRLLVAGLYFLAPIDVSKAIVAPLDRFYSPGLYLSVAHVALLALAALWLAQRLLIERRPPPFTRLDAAGLAFLAIVLLRTVGSPQGELAWASAAAYALAVLGFYVASHALETPEDLQLALRAAALAVAAEFLWVGAQVATHTALALPGSKVVPSGDMLYFGGAGEAFRPSGFLSHPNALADHMTLVLPPALALVLLGRKHLPPRLWWGALALGGAALAMLLVTLSRGGWAAFLLGAGWVVLAGWRRGVLTRTHLLRMAAAGAASLVVLVAVYPQILLRLTAPDERSTESRLILTDQALTIIGHAPWTGVGYGGYNRAAYEYIAPRFAYVSEDYQQALLQLVVHNHYLLLAAELGVPAMLYFAWLMWRFIRQPAPWRAWDDPGAFALAAGLSGALLSQALFLASDNFYADIRIFMIWLTAGTLQALCLQQARRREAERAWLDLAVARP